MGNIKRFDEQEVLDKMVHLFWEKGYEATSLDDLIEATGVQRQSLYNAFGKKEAMFIKAYEHYLEQVGSRIGTISQELPLQEQVKQIFESIIASQVDPKTPAGCFVSNCTVEFGERQSLMQQRLQEHFIQMEELFYQRVKQAQSRGELASERNARSLAQFLLAQTTAMAVIYRLNKNQSFLNNLVHEILEHLK